MLVQIGLPAEVEGITFPDDVSRTLTFRMRSDKDTTANVVYTIGPEVPNVTFANNRRELSRDGVSVTPLGVTVNTPVSFVKTNDDPVFQIPITAVPTEVGGGSSDPVDWIIAVTQTLPADAKSLSLAESGFAATLDAGNGVPDPLDRTELQRAARILRTLQAALDAALDADSPAAESPSGMES